MALWAKSRGGRTVSATVSMYKVGGDDVVVTGSSTGAVGGCTCRSCAKSQTSLIVWGGELACSLLILPPFYPLLETQFLLAWESNWSSLPHLLHWGVGTVRDNAGPFQSDRWGPLETWPWEGQSTAFWQYS